MRSYLEKIKAVHGVLGVYVLNNRAESLAQYGTESIGKQNKEKIVTEILQILASFILKGYSVIDTDFMFQNGRLLYFNFDKLNLFVHCQKNVKISMLRMTINVVMVEALDDKKIVKMINKNIIDGKLLLRPDKVDKEELIYIERIEQS